MRNSHLTNATLVLLSLFFQLIQADILPADSVVVVQPSMHMGKPSAAGALDGLLVLPSRWHDQAVWALSARALQHSKRLSSMTFSRPMITPVISLLTRKSLWVLVIDSTPATKL